MSEPAQPSTLSSPLKEALPDSISELMRRDPLDCTKQDRARNVAELRRFREIFEKEDNAPKAPKKSKLKAIEGKVDLGDLGL